MELVKIHDMPDLYSHIDDWGAGRTGSTRHITDRCKQYYSEGFRGIMYYARTGNMRAQEDELLSRGKWKHNPQLRSNAPEEEGYVYIIVGRKLVM